MCLDGTERSDNGWSTRGFAPTREVEIVEELAQYLEPRYEDLLDSGITEVEAAHTALAELSESDPFPRELRRFGSGSRQNQSLSV